MQSCSLPQITCSLNFNWNELENSSDGEACLPHAVFRQSLLLLVVAKHFFAHVTHHTLSGDVAERERITKSLT